MTFCTICNASIVATHDKSKPSERVEWLGTEWLKTKPQTICMFPTAEKQSPYCFYHENFPSGAFS